MVRTRSCLFISLLLGFGCKPVPDPIAQEFGSLSLKLPQSFESLSRNDTFSASASTRSFATEAYGANSLTSFAYGQDDIAGFAVAHETDFEAQRQHENAVGLLRGTSRVPANESTTVSDYDGYYYYDEEDPRLLFHLGNHTIFIRASSTGVSRTNSLRRVLAFAEIVFDLNNRLGTTPLRPFQLDPISVVPSNAAPLPPGPTRFEFEVAYIVDGQPSAHVSAQVRWFKAGRGLITYTDSTRVQRGTGQVSFQWDVDLTEGSLSDILSIRAHISYPNPDLPGTVTIPTTSQITPIRYNIARTN